MDNNEFMNNLITYRLLDPIWQYVSNNLLKTKNVDDELLKIFSMYFSFISSGSSCMPLDKELLFIEWKNKCDDNKILLTAAIDDEDTKEEIISNNKEVISISPKIKLNNRYNKYTSIKPFKQNLKLQLLSTINRRILRNRLLINPMIHKLLIKNNMLFLNYLE